jgi:hypothetical protein
MQLALLVLAGSAAPGFTASQVDLGPEVISRMLPLKRVSASWILMNAPEVLDAALRAGPSAEAVKRAQALLPAHQAAAARTLRPSEGVRSLEALGRAALRESFDFGAHDVRPGPERRTFFGVALHSGTLRIEALSERGIRAVEAWTFRPDIGPSGELLRDGVSERTGGELKIEVKAGQRYAALLEMDAASDGPKTGAFKFSDGPSTLQLSARGLAVNPRAQATAILEGGSLDLAAGQTVRRILKIRSSEPGAAAEITVPTIEGVAISAPSRVRIGAAGTAEAEIEFKAARAAADLPPVRAPLLVSVDGVTATAAPYVSVSSLWMASDTLHDAQFKASWWLNSSGLAVCQTEARIEAGFGFVLSIPAEQGAPILGHWQGRSGAAALRRIEAGVDLRLPAILHRLAAVEVKVYSGRDGFEFWQSESRAEPLTLKPVS